MTSAVAFRELVSASRRPGVYWMRLGITAICLLFGAWILFSLGETASAHSGREGFWAISVFGLAYCVFVGAWTTADSISSERREGTLPLLYLTRLSGCGFLMGKLAASSLTAFYGLVATFPVLAIPLLAGGIGGAEMWLTFLTLASALVFSLAAGLLASAIAVREQAASFLALTFILAPTLGGVIGGTFTLFVLIFSQIETHSAKFRDYAGWLMLFAVLVLFAVWSLARAGPFAGSPLATWYMIPDSLPVGARNYFLSLGLMWAFTLFYAYSAYLCSEWGFRERDLESVSQSSVNEESGPEFRYNYAELRAKSALRWFMVLTGPGRLFLALAVIFPALFVWMAPLGFGAAFLSPVIGFFAILAHMLLAFALARQAAWFFDGARKTGLLEVLLTTPLTLRELVREQTAASWIAVKEALGVLAMLKLGAILLAFAQRSSLGAGLLMAFVDLALLALMVQASFSAGIRFVLKGRSARAAATLTMLLVGLVPMILAQLAAAVWAAFQGGWFGVALFLVQAIVAGIYFGCLIRWSAKVGEPQLVQGATAGFASERLQRAETGVL